MSKVISFRLDADYSREAQALEVINTWVLQGYSLRFILTKALLCLGEPGSDAAMNLCSHPSNAILDRIDQVIEMLESMQPNQPFKPDTEIASSALSESFLVSVKLRAKPGCKTSV